MPVYAIVKIELKDSEDGLHLLSDTDDYLKSCVTGDLDEVLDLKIEYVGHYDHLNITDKVEVLSIERVEPKLRQRVTFECDVLEGDEETPVEKWAWEGISEDYNIHNITNVRSEYFEVED